MDAAYLTETPEGVILNVRAQPRSSRSGLDGLIGDAVKVRIRCAPVDGKANKELVETLADAFDLPKSSVVFKSGETSKTKRILLRGKTAVAVQSVLRRLAMFCIALSWSLSSAFTVVAASVVNVTQNVYIEDGEISFCKPRVSREFGFGLYVFRMDFAGRQSHYCIKPDIHIGSNDSAKMLRFPFAWTIKDGALKCVYSDVFSDAMGRITLGAFIVCDMNRPRRKPGYYDFIGESCVDGEEKIYIYRDRTVYGYRSQSFSDHLLSDYGNEVMWYGFDGTKFIARIPVRKDFVSTGDGEWMPCSSPAVFRWMEFECAAPLESVEVRLEALHSQDVSPDGFSPIGSIHVEGRRILSDDSKASFPKDADWLIWERNGDDCRLCQMRDGQWSVCGDAPRKDAPKIIVVNNDEKSVFLSYSQEFDTGDVSNSLKRIVSYLKQFEKNGKGDGGEPVRFAAEISLAARLREFHDLRARRETMHYREYNKEMERQWEELGRILCEVQKEVAQGEVSDRCKMLFRDDLIAAEAFARMLPGLRKLTVREQKKALGALMSATDARTRGKVLVTMLFSNLPLEAFEEDAVQSRLVSILRDERMAGGALYFFVEDSRWGDVVDVARAEASRFDPKVEDSDGNLCAWLSMSALARHGDKTACECLSRCFRDRKLESNRDLFFLCPILLLARDEMLAKDVLGLITGDQSVRWFGEDCVPRAMSFAHAAASACSQLIVGFPPVREGCDYVGAVKEDAEKWIVENRKLVFVEDFRRCLDTGCRLRREYRRCLRAAGPVALKTPKGVKRVNVTSAREMLKAGRIDIIYK